MNILIENQILILGSKGVQLNKEIALIQLNKVDQGVLFKIKSSQVFKKIYKSLFK